VSGIGWLRDPDGHRENKKAIPAMSNRTLPTRFRKDIRAVRQEVLQRRYRSNIIAWSSRELTVCLP
jgi:hypothetical protein